MKVYMYVVADRIAVRFNGEATNTEAIENSLEFFEYSRCYDFEIGNFYMVEKVWSYTENKSNLRVSRLLVTEKLENLIQEFVEDNLENLDVTNIPPMWQTHTQIELETDINRTYNEIKLLQRELDRLLSLATREGFNNRFANNKYILYSVNPNYLYKASPENYEFEEDYNA